jgi:hypothetical protein
VDEVPCVTCVHLKLESSNQKSVDKTNRAPLSICLAAVYPHPRTECGPRGMAWQASVAAVCLALPLNSMELHLSTLISKYQTVGRYRLRPGE